MDPLPEFRKTFHLDNWLVKSGARLLLKNYWNDVEQALTHPVYLLEILSRDPEKAGVIQTDAGKRWLNLICKKNYPLIYSYVWYGRWIR